MNIHLPPILFTRYQGFHHSPIAIFDKWMTLFWEGRPSHLSICSGIFSSDAAVSRSWRCLWNQLGNPQKETSRILANSRHKESSETTKDRESLLLMEDFHLGQLNPRCRIRIVVSVIARRSPNRNNYDFIGMFTFGKHPKCFADDGWPMLRHLLCRCLCFQSNRSIFGMSSTGFCMNCWTFWS